VVIRLIGGINKSNAWEYDLLMGLVCHGCESRRPAFSLLEILDSDYHVLGERVFISERFCLTFLAVKQIQTHGFGEQWDMTVFLNEVRKRGPENVSNKVYLALVLSYAARLGNVSLRTADVADALLRKSTSLFF
jgi:hypothetical protein